jgi:hypothetical protein
VNTRPVGATDQWLTSLFRNVWSQSHNSPKIPIGGQTGDQRLLLLHGRFEDLSLVLRDVVAETERERYAQRATALREAEKPDTGAAAA